MYLYAHTCSPTLVRAPLFKVMTASTPDSFLNGQNGSQPTLHKKKQTKQQKNSMGTMRRQQPWEMRWRQNAGEEGNKGKRHFRWKRLPHPLKNRAISLKCGGWQKGLHFRLSHTGSLCMATDRKTTPIVRRAPRNHKNVEALTFNTPHPLSLIMQPSTQNHPCSNTSVLR